MKHVNTVWDINRFGILTSPIQRIRMGGCGRATQGLRTSGTPHVVSWDELFAASQKFGQTLDATIIGIPQNADAAKVLEGISDLSLFPKSPVALVIRAVDSSFFEVMTKNHDHVELLKKCFRDVREEDSTSYFAASVIR